MNSFLQHVYWDNTVENYLIVLGIILLGFILKKYIAHYIVAGIYFLINRRYKNVDLASFKNLVARPLGFFVAVLITVIALDKLTFPHQLDFSIYHLSLQELLRMAGSALLIISFFSFLIKCIDFIVLLIKEKYVQGNDPGSHQLVFFFKDFIKVLIGIVGILMLLKYTFHYDIKGLLTGLSIVGAAVALALKESLENLIASFIIFFDKPFAAGDSVKGNNFSGVVEKIGLRSTRIRTDAKTYVTVPNKQMVDSVLDNLSNRTQRRADLHLEIGVDTPNDKVDALLKGIKEILSVPEIQNFNLYFNNIIANALVINADYYTAPVSLSDFNSIKQKVNIEIIQLMNTVDVDMAGKTTSVSIVNDNSGLANATSQPQQ